MTQLSGVSCIYTSLLPSPSVSPYVIISKPDFSDEENVSQEQGATDAAHNPESMMDFRNEYMQPKETMPISSRSFGAGAGMYTTPVGDDDTLMQHSHVPILPEGCVLEDGSMTSEQVTLYTY